MFLGWQSCLKKIKNEVNDAGRITKLNARKTKLMVVGYEKANLHIDVDGEARDKGPIL